MRFEMTSSSETPGPVLGRQAGRIGAHALRRTAALVCLSMAIALVGLLAPTSIVAVEFEAIGVPMKLVKVTERVYYVQGQQGMVSSANEGFNSNAGFVVTDAGVVVFDALGTPALGAAFLKLIRSVTDLPIKRVVVSHYHSDHFYGVQAFKPTGAEIWAAHPVREYLRSDAPEARLEERRQSLFPWVNEETRVLPPDHYVDEDTHFEVGGVHFRLFLAGPAHTREDMMMLVEEEGVLFAGDLMFTGRVPFVGDADSKAWLAALDKLVALAPKQVIVGHGPYSTDANRDLTLTRDYLRYLRKTMGRAVEDMESFDEAYARADWSRFSDLPAFSDANRRNAYNTFILMERESLSR